MKLMRALTVVCMAACSLVVNAQQTDYSKYFKSLPFAMSEVKAPQIPEREVKLTDFGAKGDGQTLCTEAFQKAISTLKGQGGGHLIVPQGVWLTGPITLESNIDLHLNHGAIILFSGDIKLYPFVETIYEGGRRTRCQSPITGMNLQNVSITGSGVIDGNGVCWRPLKKEKVTEGQWKKITSQGGMFVRATRWQPSEEHANHRPVMVHLESCKNVLLQGVIFQNSPAWNLHPLMCENIIIDQVLVRNPAYAQNGDALDLESCKNALIVNSRFDAGDDGICIKSGKDKDGRRRGIPCENVVVDGCTVFAGHGGFVVGSEMSGGVKNIKVGNCQFVGTDVGLRFKSTRGRGGIVENIFIDGISMSDISTYALTFNMYYGGKSVAEMLADGDNPDNQTKMPVNEETPIFRNINIKNIVCNDAGRAMEFNGLPEMPIDGITLENVMIQAKKDAVFTNCQNIKKTNVVVKVVK